MLHKKQLLTPWPFVECNARKGRKKLRIWNRNADCAVLMQSLAPLRQQKFCSNGFLIGPRSTFESRTKLCRIRCNRQDKAATVVGTRLICNFGISRIRLSFAICSLSLGLNQFGSCFLFLE